MTESDDKSGRADEPGSDEQTTEFGSPFDYDATAEASLSAPPATSEIGPVTGATGSGSGSGPGWDVHSGVGNGPGWGETPSYPPPSSEQGSGPVYGPPDPNYQQQDHSGQTDSPVRFDKPGEHGSSQNYAPPAPGYDQPQGYGAQQGYGPQPGYGLQQGFGPQQGYGPPPGYPVAGGYYGAPYGMDPAAPYGRHPITGEPLSDKSKLTAGLLEILLGAFGAGRFYLDQPGIAVAQIAVTWLTCGIGGLWPLIDGIMMLTGSVRDKNGRPLHD